jgi:hypothetical protein
MTSAAQGGEILARRGHGEERLFVAALLRMTDNGGRVPDKRLDEGWSARMDDQ